MKLFLKIIGFSMVGFLLIAFVLYLNGVTHVDFDTRYYQFLTDVNVRLNDWSGFKIPKIPLIEHSDMSDQGWAQALWDGIVNFGNMILQFINVISAVLNYVLGLIKFVAALVSCFVEDIPMIFNSSGSSSTSEVSLPIL